MNCKPNIGKYLEETDGEIYLTEKEVSEIAKIAIQTLRNHRCRGCGIDYSKNGRSVRYKLKDVFNTCKIE